MHLTGPVVNPVILPAHLLSDVRPAPFHFGQVIGVDIAEHLATIPNTASVGSEGCSPVTGTPFLSAVRGTRRRSRV